MAKKEKFNLQQIYARHAAAGDGEWSYWVIVRGNDCMLDTAAGLFANKTDAEDFLKDNEPTPDAAAIEVAISPTGKF